MQPRISYEGTEQKMNLAQLRAFTAVVEHGTFSAAARALGITQPAVTQQIQGLEADLDATLLDRHYRRVDLTEQGRALLPYARKILDQLESARRSVERLSDTVTGRLLVAASTTPGQYVLPGLFGSFVKQYPDVGVHLDVADTAAVIELVESGEVDLGMTGAQVPGTRAVFEQAGVDKLVMIAPPDSPTVAEEGLELADLVDHGFILREVGSGTRVIMEETFASAGIALDDLHVVIELGTSEAIVTAVEGGLGIGVVSHWMAEKALELGRVARVDVAHFPVERPFYLVVPKRTASRAAGAFLDFVRDAL